VRLKLAPVRRRRVGIGCGTVRKASPVARRAGGWRAEAASWRGCPVAQRRCGRCTNGTAVTANATQGRRVSRLRLRQRLDRVICNKAMRDAVHCVLRGKTMLNVRCPQCKDRDCAASRGGTCGGCAAGSARQLRRRRQRCGDKAAARRLRRRCGAAKSVAAPATAAVQRRNRLGKAELKNTARHRPHTLQQEVIGELGKSKLRETILQALRP